VDDGLVGFSWDELGELFERLSAEQQDAVVRSLNAEVERLLAEQDAEERLAQRR
jgi:hypothetical protein